MQSMQWTNELVAIAVAAGLALVLIGYLLAAVILGRDRAALREKLHQHELAASGLAEQLRNAQAESARHAEQLGRLQLDRDNLGQQLDAAQQKLHATEKAVEAMRAELQAQGERLQEAKAGLRDGELERKSLHEQIVVAQREKATLETAQREREEGHAREVANFEQQKASLKEQFQLLANEILEARAKALQEHNQLTLSAVMNPFQQSIDSFKKEVQDIHHRETTQQGELRKELESLKALNQQITAEAHELSTALRGQKKLQGNWGELVLENVLDRSGLRQGADYEREVSITTEDGRQRPDVVVRLPQDKHLIIDAKVSLNAYTRYVNAEDEAERLLALKEHVQAVASRIRELADRDYFRLPGLNSPEMVFMFIPIESAFVEALKADETLFQQAIERNVLVATPTTLLTSLNIVRQLWRYEDQNKHTAALAGKAESVFRKLNTFLESFHKVKKGLDTAMVAYETAQGQLVGGRGNLVKQVSDFRNLAPAIRGELPEHFMEKAALEIDYLPPDAPEGAPGADDPG